MQNLLNYCRTFNSYGGFVAVILLIQFVRWYWVYRASQKGKFAGIWRQEVFKNGLSSQATEIDQVTVKHFKDVITADAIRILPAEDHPNKVKQWKFSGKLLGSQLYGHYWRDKPDHLSVGAFLMKYGDDRQVRFFEGVYMRYKRTEDQENPTGQIEIKDKDIRIIPFKWTR